MAGSGRLVKKMVTGLPNNRWDAGMLRWDVLQTVIL